MDIENELKNFNVTDAAISELTSNYMPLVINGIDDKDGIKAIKEARSVVKRHRIDIDKRRKELNADALEYQRRINGEAKRITDLLEPIEAHLEAQEKKVDDELDRIKREKEEAEAARFKVRVTKLTGLKFMFDGVHYYSTYLDTFNNEAMKVSVFLLKQMTDEVFNDFYDNAKHYFEIEEKDIAEKKERDDAERKALAEERAKLDAIAIEQAAKDAALKAESERIEALKNYEESKAAVIAGCESHQGQSCFEAKENVSNPEIKEELKIESNLYLREWRKDIIFWEGFDACLEMVLNHLDNADPHDLPITLKDDILENAELYKKDG